MASGKVTLLRPDSYIGIDHTLVEAARRKGREGTEVRDTVQEKRV